MVTSEVVLDVVSHIIIREEKVAGLRRGMPLFAYTIKSHTWREARGFFETISTIVCVPFRPTFPLVVVVGEH